MAAKITQQVVTDLNGYCCIQSLFSSTGKTKKSVGFGDLKPSTESEILKVHIKKKKGLEEKETSPL